MQAQFELANTSPSSRSADATAAGLRARRPLPSRAGPALERPRRHGHRHRGLAGAPSRGHAGNRRVARPGEGSPVRLAPHHAHAVVPPCLVRLVPPHLGPLGLQPGRLHRGVPFRGAPHGAAADQAHAYWIGPFVVFTLHLLLVLPLARLGLPYAVGALDYRLVGFSVMAYSIAGAAFTPAAPPTVAWFAAGLVAYEVALAVLYTGPFIFAYHLGGFALGYWVRTLLLR